MTAFLYTKRFCQNCLKGYNYKNHRCVYNCKYCNSVPPERKEHGDFVAHAAECLYQTTVMINTETTVPAKISHM